MTSPSCTPILCCRLQRVAVVLLVLHYTVEFLYHTSRMLHYYGKNVMAMRGCVLCGGVVTAIVMCVFSVAAFECGRCCSYWQELLQLSLP